MGFVFLATALLIGYIKPYKKWYMNALDTLLLAFLSVTCQLLSRDYFSAENTQMLIMFIMPGFIFVLLLILKGFTKLKSKVMSYHESFCKVQCDKETDFETDNHDSDHSSQPLLLPASASLDIKLYGSTKKEEWSWITS